MKVIILAAGRGTRLKPLASKIPKCMIPICDKPILKWQVELLQKCGITDITIVTGGLAKKIKIHPKKAAAKVSKTKLRVLHAEIQRVLAKAIEQGGTTLRDFTRSDGQPGYFKQELFVYAREGEACKNCDSTIKRITLGQRSTFFCSLCQR